MLPGVRVQRDTKADGDLHNGEVVEWEMNPVVVIFSWVAFVTQKMARAKKPTASVCMYIHISGYPQFGFIHRAGQAQRRSRHSQHGCAEPYMDGYVVVMP